MPFIFYFQLVVTCLGKASSSEHVLQSGARPEQLQYKDLQLSFQSWLLLTPLQNLNKKQTVCGSNSETPQSFNQKVKVQRSITKYLATKKSRPSPEVRPKNLYTCFVPWEVWRVGAFGWGKTRAAGEWLNGPMAFQGAGPAAGRCAATAWQSCSPGPPGSRDEKRKLSSEKR